MRVRKLGKGQSVAFCGSREIQQKIRDCTGRIEGAIGVADVLLWCFAVTCAQAWRSIPLRRTQGVRHQRRQPAYYKLSSATGSSRVEFVRSILEPEAQSLEQRYGNCVSQEFPTADDEGFVSRERQLESIRARCQEFGGYSFDAATLQEEQEREISPENEREQQDERPRTCQPHKHSIREDVRQLVETGVLNRTSNAFKPVFQIFQKTTAFVFAACELFTTDTKRLVILLRSLLPKDYPEHPNPRLEPFRRPALPLKFRRIRCSLRVPRVMLRGPQGWHSGRQ